MKISKEKLTAIEAQMRERVEKKYEWEKAESERIKKIKDDFYERSLSAAKEAVLKVYENISEYKDIFDYHEDILPSNLRWAGIENILNLKDIRSNESVHHWKSHINKEVNEKMEEIKFILSYHDDSREEIEKILSKI